MSDVYQPDPSQPSEQPDVVVQMGDLEAAQNQARQEGMMDDDRPLRPDQLAELANDGPRPLRTDRDPTSPMMARLRCPTCGTEHMVNMGTRT